MINVLTLNSSLNGNAGNSNKLVSDFVNKLSKSKDISLTQRDLSQDNLPHLSGNEMHAWMTDPVDRSADQIELAKLSDDLIAELQNNDVIVIGMPMYNFGVPSVFKSWIDRVARVGITFRYSENGPVGLLNNKKVYVLASRGGMYAGTEKDSQTQYLKDVLSFLGLANVEFVYAEGLAMGEDSSKSAFESAQTKIIELIDNIAA